MAIPNPSLEITTVIGCSNMCVYCPQKVLIGSYKDKEKKLTLENFIKILENVPKNVEICFAGFGEPFLNKEASKMMKHTIEQGYKIVIYTTLTGFDDSDVEVLSDVKSNMGVDFHRYVGNNFDEETFQMKMNIFWEKIIKKPKPPGYIGRTVNDVWSRGGNLYDEVPKEGKLWCKSTCLHDTFDRNVVLPNGDVYLCCMDYGLKHKIGNLLETNFNDLDRSEVIKLCNMEKSDVLCRKCTVAGIK